MMGNEGMMIVVILMELKGEGSQQGLWVVKIVQKIIVVFELVSIFSILLLL